MAKLKDILQSKQGVDLEFVDLIQDETADGLPIIRLVLAKPLGAVFGRQITDPVTQDRVRLEANDVTLVSIGKEAIDALNDLEDAGETPFVWDEEGKSGKLKCNLFMDVSNALEAWVVKTKFATFASNQRKSRQQNRTSNLVSNIRAAKTKAEFKDTNVTKNKPEPVEDEK